MKIRTITALLLLLTAVCSLAQEEKPEAPSKLKGWVFECAGFAGRQIKIYPDYPKNGINGYFEANVGYKTFGTKPWHADWRYPQYGVAFLYGYLGNPAVLGNNYSLLPYLLLESKDSRKITADVRVGVGLAHFDTRYNRISNPDNIIIGSRFTGIANLSVNLRKRLSSHWALYGGVSFIHCSNGHSHLPNVGMNTVALNAGLRYYPAGKPLPQTTKSNPAAKDRPVMMNLRFGYGTHEFGSATKPLGGPHYPVYALSVFASKRFGKISNGHAGIFVNYYTGFYDYIRNQNFYDTGQRGKSITASIFVGHEFLIGRFGLVWQSGVNIYNPFQRDYYKLLLGSGTSAMLKTYWCNKIGGQVYLFRPSEVRRFNMWFGIYIKTNLMTADFAESAVGVRF
jgi:hypothetical protein